MQTTKVKNVVFDVGNVLVKWSPGEIVRRTFGESVDMEQFIESIFQHELWMALNKGELSEESAKQEYLRVLDVSESQIDTLFHQIKDTQELIEGTSVLLIRLYNAGYPLYALTDNVNEIVKYLRSRYDFWKYFEGVVVSAEVKCMKPNPEIFNHLLTDHDIRADETVFIDDHLPNVQGARNLGFSAIHFSGAEYCESELKGLGLVF